MSFDKMNMFVEEHTCLMREFLRNISTLSADEIAEETAAEAVLAANPLEFDAEENYYLTSFDNSKIVLGARHTPKALPLLTLTPETPGSTASMKTTAATRAHSLDPVEGSPITKNSDLETNFELDPIDLGKQMSILACLLNTIIASLDQVNKLTDKQEILVYII